MSQILEQAEKLLQALPKEQLGFFPTPFLLSCQKKRKRKPSRLSGARFRLAASFFLLAQKETKNAPGVGRG